MRFSVAALSLVSLCLLSVAEESPAATGDSVKDAITDGTTPSPNATVVLHNEPVNSEQKVSNMSASKDKPEESVADKVTGAANDAKDAVAGAAKSAGQTASGAAGSAADKVSEAANGCGTTTLSVLSAVFMVAFAFYTSH